MIKLEVNGSDMNYTACGSGEELMAEAGTFVEALLSELAKDCPSGEKEGFIQLADLFCYILIKHATETN